ncbi:DUF6268 family outer membrane beta-barrel protein [Patiriisocius hiemis]|uniref:DUF6268 family outer membrane beta-barrel protein n=1 Tax=Patiriisocius hiemis TaxID=3075604 RepID=A0ABU2YEZ3_9FLAO|nr:DUF6268 family outer membrane beta-barrel protein [Constantimarinum sp. W242]MDT0556761.1 DUF6268 family outer membrane beta-barrel protein [Constantimarinum sp. W242]
MIKKLFCLLFFVSRITCSLGQTTDLARIEYTYAPQSSSDNSFRRFRTFLNFPIPIAEDDYLVAGIEYRNINILLKDDLPFNNEGFERYQSFKFTVGYTAKMKNDWRYAIKAETIIASDFSRRINGDDFIYGGSLFFIKDRTGGDEVKNVKKPWRIILGATYGTNAGRPFPLPIINYFRKMHPNWSYTLGVPKTNLKYYITDKHILQGFVTLDGFFANIQEDINLPNNKAGSTISMTTVLSGMGYEYLFTKNLLFYFYGGHTLINDIRLRNDNADDVLTLNDANTFYLRSGIKFKI